MLPLDKLRRLAECFQKLVLLQHVLDNIRSSNNASQVTILNHG